MFTCMTNLTKSTLNFLAEQCVIALQISEREKQRDKERERERERRKGSFKRRIHVTFVYGECLEAT